MKHIKYYIDQSKGYGWKGKYLQTGTNIIVSICKNKGHKLQCHKYRGISLLYTRYKISKYLNNRLKNMGMT
jgi:hypothetical protein